jgi:hypothetical protein
LVSLLTRRLLNVWNFGITDIIQLALLDLLTVLTFLNLALSILDTGTIITKNATALTLKVVAYLSMLIVAVVDYDRRFIDVVVGWPGSE